MDYFSIWAIFTDFNTVLKSFAYTYPHWIYVLVFVIIFCETGLVVLPFLPGDSLLFLLGAFAGAKLINIWVLFPLIVVAALCGDSLNYEIGRFFRGKISDNNRWIKKKYIIKTEQFYEKYGGLALILARFTPIVRTYAPFVGGFTGMPYRRFFVFNFIGAFLWVSIFIPLGYLLGNNKFISDHLTTFVLIIIMISFIPIGFGVIKHKLELRSLRKKALESAEVNLDPQDKKETTNN